MKRKLKIGIIGAGNIGGALSRHFTRLGYDAVVYRKPLGGTATRPAATAGHLLLRQQSVESAPLGLAA